MHDLNELRYGVLLGLSSIVYNEDFHLGTKICDKLRVYNGNNWIWSGLTKLCWKYIFIFLLSSLPKSSRNFINIFFAFSFYFWWRWLLYSVSISICVGDDNIWVWRASLVVEVWTGVWCRRFYLLFLVFVINL